MSHVDYRLSKRVAQTASEYRIQKGFHVFAERLAHSNRQHANAFKQRGLIRSRTVSSVSALAGSRIETYGSGANAFTLKPSLM